MRRVVAIPLAAISLLVLAGCGFEARRLDAQMEELCKKDGGVKVYETVTLPARSYSSPEGLLSRYVSTAKSEEDRLGPDYKYVRKEEILVGLHANAQKGEGQLGRHYFAIYRRADGKLLGESVEYARGGGDGFTFGFQPSGNHCPKPRVGLETSVFLKGN